MELLLGTNEGRAAYRQRVQTVDPTIGHLKDRGGMREYRMRGMDKTRTEALLASMGNNIKKLWRRTRNDKSNRNQDNMATGPRPVASMISGGDG